MTLDAKEESEEKPCPFCGSEAIVTELGARIDDPNTPSYCMVCLDCEAKGPPVLNHEEAWQKWNRRK